MASPPPHPFGSTPDDDRAAVPVERLLVWLVAVVLVVAVAGTFVAYGDRWRRDDPNADFAFDYDAATATVTVEHVGGMPIRDTGTRSLVLTFVDASTGATANVTWASDRAGDDTDRGTGYPVTEGDRITVDDPTVDADGDGNYLDADASVGFHFDSGDEVRVVWTGSLHDARVESVTLDRFSIP
ncbi:MAG: hypothetical protein ABEI96_03705 [Haloarculaceae archaeon]